MSNRKLFVLRDGGLVNSLGTVTLTPAAAELGSLSPNIPPDLPMPVRGALPALRRFCQAGFDLVLLVPSADDAGDAFLLALLDSQGVEVAAVERCDHGPGADCDCAPPGLGLVRSYVADPTLDRSESIVVGGSAAASLAADMGLRGFELTAGGNEITWEELAHELLDAPRTASVQRRTNETSIDIELDLDRAAPPRISTGIGFFDHMLEQLGKHGSFTLSVTCTGDLEVDEHHTVEDVAITIGEALRSALGSKRGIARYGFTLPMDEANAVVSVDLSGRPYFVFDGEFRRENVGGLPTELVPHFFRSLADSMRATLHLKVIGDNDHHKIEASFKAVARALAQAFRRDGDDLPSTKGAL